MISSFTKWAILPLLAGMALSTAVHAERLSISTWGSPLHPQVKDFIPAFTEALKENSDGAFRLRVFQGGEMVKQEFVATAIPQGTVDISLTTLDTWSGRVSDVSILTSPLWNKSMQWTKNHLLPGQPIFEYFNEKFKEQGAVILAMFDIGPAVVASRDPIALPKDIKGHSIRVYSRGAGLIIQELGGSPVTMGVGDVYSALQRGTIDGAMGGLGGAVGLKYYEVANYMLAQNGVIGSLVHAYVMNKDKYDKLSPELRKALVDAVASARDTMQQVLIDTYAKQLDEVRQAGNIVTELTPGSPDWKTWEAALQNLSASARQSYPSPLVGLVTAE